jgi:hypothetical protein
VIDADDTSEPASSSPPPFQDEEQGGADTSDSAFNPAVALAFWCCLALSAVLFAAVALSPKARTYRELRHEYDAIEGKVTFEERQVRHLQQVAEALQNDPDFASELARKDFGTNESEERIAVDPKLSLDDASKLNPSADRVAASGSKPGVDRLALLETPLLDQLCDSPLVRRSLLGAASFLLLIGFTFLSGDRRLAGQADLSTRCRQWLANRYFQPKL